MTVVTSSTTNSNEDSRVGVMDAKVATRRGPRHSPAFPSASPRKVRPATWDELLARRRGCAVKTAHIMRTRVPRELIDILETGMQAGAHDGVARILAQIDAAGMDLSGADLDRILYEHDQYDAGEDLEQAAYRLDPTPQTALRWARKLAADAHRDLRAAAALRAKHGLETR